MDFFQKTETAKSWRDWGCSREGYQVLEGAHRQDLVRKAMASRVPIRVQEGVSMPSPGKPLRRRGQVRPPGSCSAASGQL